MNPRSKFLRTVVPLAASLMTQAGAETLFTSEFNGNTGAVVLAGNTVNTAGNPLVTIIDWVTVADVSAISGLTAISTGDSGTIGGFAQLQNGTATYANANNIFLARNHNLDTNRSTSKRGYSFTFTLDSSWDPTTLTVLSGHTTNTGNTDQVYPSTLVVSLSGGTLPEPVTLSSTEDYNNAPAYHSVALDFTGTTLAAGTYTLEVYQTNMTDGGAYATYDGITLLADPTPPDTDGDGLSDIYEQGIIDFDPNDAVAAFADVMGTGASPAVTDFDNDGSNDAEEKPRFTDPTDPDSDDDGLYDGAESKSGVFVGYDYNTNTGDTGTDPLDDDSDNDGLLDGVEDNGMTFVSENRTGTSPLDDDSDGDDLIDGWEVTYDLDPNLTTFPDGRDDDSDIDNLTNFEEQGYGTDPKNDDTDGDDVFDDVEIFVDLTDPLLFDTDADDLSDGAEKTAGTNPLNPDSDNDVFPDGTEVDAGSDPLSGASVPAASILSSNFDANTGAAVIAGNADNTQGSATVGVTWIPRAGVTVSPDLTAISTGDSGTASGFIQTQNGTATFGNENNLLIGRNLNMDTDRTTSKRGYSLTFTLDSGINLGELLVRSGHTSASGNQDQFFSSDLVVELSGGTLANPVTRTMPENYDNLPPYHNVVFDLTGTSLGAGTYTLEVYQSNLLAGGAYSIYDGIALSEGEAVPAPLQITSVSYAGGTFSLVVTGLDTAKSYVLKRSENLIDGFPTTIGAPFTPASATETLMDTSAGGPKGFYRVEETP